MILTQEDLQWVAKRIREKYDMPKAPWEEDDINKECIERARRFGIYDLVYEMESDMKFRKAELTKEHL